MKYLKILPLVLGTFVMSSCIDELDTYPEGGTVTQDQKDEITEKDPSKLDADLQGMYSGLTSAFNTFGRSENIHFDYSYPAIVLMLETSGADMPSKVTGYNWFSDDVTYEDRIYTSYQTLMIWKRFYQGIMAANAVIKSVDPETEDVGSLFYVGQAKAMRAFCYFQLAQIFQFTYADSKEKLCVPLITETSEGNNHPRQTVEKVYEQIMNDLNAAITMLETAKKAGYKRVDKAHIDYNVACGIRARVNLLMGNYTEAIADATAALSGYAPYSKSEVAVPAFNDVTSNSWIWGLIYTTESSAVKTGIVNWPSHLCSMSKNSYSSTGVHRMINSTLWAQIPESDVRKGWWVDEELSSPLSDELYVDGKTVAKAYKFTPYTNVKFGAYKNDPGSSDNAQDFPMMRAEEMLLIIAEATAMGGNPTGAAEMLQEFVNQYRDEDYVCNATSAESVRDAIWWQRRVELWGEGFALFDILRFNKGVDRRGENNFEESVRYNILPGDPNLIFRIPQSEVESNLGIEESDNNPSAELPTA